MDIKIYEKGPLQANNYLLTDNGESVLIDCSGAFDDIKNLKYILLTHGHFDHVLGVNEMKKRTGAKVYVFKDDVQRMNESPQIMESFGVGGVETPVADEFLTDGQVFKFGNSEIKVIHTPGHTEGGVCYLVDGKLFSGDTLFKESVGRCDLAGGNFKKLQHSVKDILFKLDDETEVFPGHGMSTTIGYEKANNEII